MGLICTCSELSVLQLISSAHFGGELFGVSHYDQGDVFVTVEFDEQVSKRFCSRMIKCAGGFVGENEAGSIDQCTHDSNALAFPTG